MSPSIKKLPAFGDLPLHPSDPPHSAWRIWGDNDQLGCLNHLTPDRIVEAAKEIRTGISVGLSWGLNEMRIPPPFRMQLEHNIFQLSECINDDQLSFNTQSGSQWDGFRHWSFSDGRLYNGITQEEVRSGESSRLGIQEWTRKGIVGRGVLIDYSSYAQEQGLQYHPWSFHPIPVSVVKEIAVSKNLTFKIGDILFLRTGFMRQYESMSDADLASTMDNPEYKYPGLEGSPQSLEWLWNTHFAAVAADSPGFEAWSAAGGEVGAGTADWFRMHETLLAGFGLPIGELFNLEGLAEECKRQGRWTFFVTSQPLNVLGGIASPPNPIAIF